MKEEKNFFEDKEDSDKAWYEKRSDGSAWFEKESSWNTEYLKSDDGGSGMSDPDLEKEENTFSPVRNQGEKRQEKEPERNRDIPTEEGKQKEINAYTGSLNLISEDSVFQEENGKNKIREGEKESFQKTEESFKKEDAEKDEEEYQELHYDIPSFAPDAGMIYLPNPPPPSEADKIVDQREYIKRKMEEQEAKDNDSRKKKKESGEGTVILIFALGLMMAFFNFLFNAESYFPIFFAIMLFLFLILAILIIHYKKHRPKADGFFIALPYAIKKEENPENKNCGLRVYYEAKDGYREATTEKIYTEKQIKELVNSFRSGKLIVACRKEIFSDDIAVILEF